MNKKFFGALLLLSSASFGLVHQPGFYIDAKLGDGTFKELNDIEIKKSGLSWQANVGYEFTDFLALEVGYLQFPKFSVTAPSTTLTVTPSGETLSAKLMMPFDQLNQIRIHFKYSAVNLHNFPDLHHRDNSPRYVTKGQHELVGMGSFGMAYEFVHNTYLNGEVMYSSLKDMPNMTLGMMGITHKF